MYFLDGDRIYIKPFDSSVSLNEQLVDCLSQLDQINEGKKIFKLNFFADTPSDESYITFRQKVNELVSDRFTTPVLTSLIGQPPLTCKVLVEACYYDASLWGADYISGQNGSAMLFKRQGAVILIGKVQASESKLCRVNAQAAFKSFEDILSHANLKVSSVVRQWNYLQDILKFEGEKQRYQEFNNVRSTFYGDNFNKTGYPAATGIGMNFGGVIIEFIAVSSKMARSIPLDNPGQIPAHGYSGKVLVGCDQNGKTTPKFERARYLELFGKRLVLISGTASISGEKTVGKENPGEQTRITIENIMRLYSPVVLSQISKNNFEPKYGHIRVYLKKREDFDIIKNTFRQYFGDIPVVYIQADICREDLLVEIEGKVIL